MAKQRKTAHAELDQLQEQATAQRVKARNLEAQLEAAKVAVEDASRAVTDAYAAEDANSPTSAASSSRLPRAR